MTQRRVDRGRLERADRESKLAIEAEREIRNAKTARLRQQRLSVEASAGNPRTNAPEFRPRAHRLV